MSIKNKNKTFTQLSFYTNINSYLMTKNK